MTEQLRGDALQYNRHLKFQGFLFIAAGVIAVVWVMGDLAGHVGVVTVALCLVLAGAAICYLPLRQGLLVGSIAGAVLGIACPVLVPLIEGDPVPSRNFYAWLLGFVLLGIGSFNLWRSRHLVVSAEGVVTVAEPANESEVGSGNVFQTIREADALERRGQIREAVTMLEEEIAAEAGTMGKDMMIRRLERLRKRLPPG